MLRKNRLVLILGTLFLLLPTIVSLLNYYTDWLFFAETGFSSVFTTTLYAKTGVGLLFGVILFAAIMTNLLYANSLRFPLAGLFVVGGLNLRMQREEAMRLVKPVSMLAALLLALFAGNWGAERWEEVLLFANGVNVGMVDPVIGKDIGFYLFSLPFWEMLRGFIGFILITSALMVAALYYVRGGIVLTERGAAIDEKVRRQFWLYCWEVLWLPVFIWTASD
jgi:uncharacterized membrane protein (UPF0182 family)